jgi:hypothetical protein
MRYTPKTPNDLRRCLGDCPDVTPDKPAPFSHIPLVYGAVVVADLRFDHYARLNQLCRESSTIVTRKEAEFRDPNLPHIQSITSLSRPPIPIMYLSYSAREIRPPSHSTRARSFADKKVCTSSTRFHGARGVSQVERGTNSDVASFCSGARSAGNCGKFHSPPP